jgi:pimeloyl-ACP methyl ester carboxylesterase
MDFLNRARHPRLHLIRLSLRATMVAGLLTGTVHPALAAVHEPWKTLPATPGLPAPTSSGSVRIQDIQMYYARFGRGAPILLLHGGLANSNYWAKIIPALVAQHFEVIVADSRGHGRSTRSGHPFSYELMAADVMALLDFLEVRTVDLVGWSDGGIIGLEIAIQHPDRIHKLIIYGTNSDPSGVRNGFEREPVFAAYVKRARHEYAQLSRTPSEFSTFLSQIERMWASEPRISSSELAKVKAPTLVLVGTHDEAIAPEHTDYLVRTIPGASRSVLASASHFGMLQVPNFFSAAVLQFLSRP